MNTTGKEILPLTSVRGLAALWVVIYHLYSQFTTNGWIASGSQLTWNLIGGGSAFSVELFFVLSGFILATTYQGRFHLQDFVWHRISRVVPLHWAVLSAMVVVTAMLQRVGIRPGDASFFSWQTLPLQYLLVDVWFGLEGWNAPTWSLCAEMAAYACFPLLHYATYGKSRWATPLTAVFLLAHVALVSTFSFSATGLVAIGRGVFGFAAGMMLQRATQGRSIPPVLLSLSLLALAIMAATGFYVLTIVVSAALVVALAASQAGAVHRFMSSAVAVWLGRVSFSVYLVHSPILLAFTQFLRRLPVLHDTAAALLLTVAGYLVLTMVVSAITYRFIEVPARQALRKRLRPPGTNAKVLP